ncbi:hypothetical protein ACN47E_008564 [Coniothyrium glycines]
MMFGPRTAMGALVALGAFLPALVTAQNNTTVTAASTLYIPETETQFSLNVANDSSDVFMYITTPAYSWFGVGFGSQMENSLMFIVYPNEKGDNVTISPRFGSKNTEPTFTPTTELKVLEGSRINDSMLVLKARCRNCRVWPKGFLDLQSQAQEMIYAFGDGNMLQSNSPSADLKRHVRYGHFTMDMLSATGMGGVPAQSSAPNGVSMSGGMTRDGDRARLAHAIVGCVALFVIWPLNILLAGFFRNIKIHVCVSALIMVFLIIAYALGISTSAQFNRSKNYNTPHQITAFISLLPLLLLGILPLPSLSSLHARLPALHTPLVSLSFILLVLTGGLGLHLAAQARPVLLAYSAIALLVFVFSSTLQACIARRGSAFARATGRQRARGRDDHVDGHDDNDDQVPMRKMSDSRTDSAASLRTPPPYYQGSAAASREFGADGQRRLGGGTMPGPQYLLNMHPGVPVQVSRM